MKSAGKARNNGLYRHIRTSKEIIRNLLNDYPKFLVSIMFFIIFNSFLVTYNIKHRHYSNILSTLHLPYKCENDCSTFFRML